MLKQQATSASTVFSRSSKPFALYSPVIIPKMSTAEAPIRPQEPKGIDRADVSDDEAPLKQTKVAPPNTRYFPLGYKDAAYQWVRVPLDGDSDSRAYLFNVSLDR